LCVKPHTYGASTSAATSVAVRRDPCPAPSATCRCPIVSCMCAGSLLLPLCAPHTSPAGCPQIKNQLQQQLQGWHTGQVLPACPQTVQYTIVRQLQPVETTNHTHQLPIAKGHCCVAADEAINDSLCCCPGVRVKADDNTHGRGDYLWCLRTVVTATATTAVQGRQAGHTAALTA
jgi:hypothetical protein